MTKNDSGDAVHQFLRDRIESVPQLEALLLLWKSRPMAWGFQAVARELFLKDEIALGLLQGLARECLVATASEKPGEFYYESHTDRDLIVGLVEATYRRELVRVSRLIHSHASVHDARS